MSFYVYAITFDQDTFGVFATREEAEKSLKRQISEGGPAWGDCDIERWRIEGEPELVTDGRPALIDTGPQDPANQVPHF